MTYHFAIAFCPVKSLKKEICYLGEHGVIKFKANYYLPGGTSSLWYFSEILFSEK